MIELIKEFGMAGFERLEKRDDTANRSNIEEQMPGYTLEEDDFPF